jgi:hypothetical protein
MTSSKKNEQRQVHLQTISNEFVGAVHGITSTFIRDGTGQCRTDSLRRAD